MKQLLFIVYLTCALFSLDIYLGSPHGIMVKVLNSNIVVSSNSSYSLSLFQTKYPCETPVTLSLSD